LYPLLLFYGSYDAIYRFVNHPKGHIMTNYTGLANLAPEALKAALEAIAAESDGRVTCRLSGNPWSLTVTNLADARKVMGLFTLGMPATPSGRSTATASSSASGAASPGRW
jgi:hypothetical protein